MKTGIVATTIFLLGLLGSAQDKPSRVLLRAYHGSSGPFGGEKGASCFMLYSDGRLVEVSSSTAALGVPDDHGKVTHPESTTSREYRFPERDSWQVSGYVDFLRSRALRKLNSYFPPPHRPIDYVETSTVEVFFPTGKRKQIQAREYYVASLEEKAKYPSALIILMDKLEQLEDTVAQKGIPTQEPEDCSIERSSVHVPTSK
jgi:hypothetical protein